jgi:hypothetical protein
VFFPESVQRLQTLPGVARVAVVSESLRRREWPSGNAIGGRVKRELWKIAPTLSIYDTATVEGLIDQSVVRYRFSATRR